MVYDIPRIERPELIFGFVAPIGADVTKSVSEFERYFIQRGYHVEIIKVTDVFKALKKFIPPTEPLKEHPLHDRYNPTFPI